MPCISRQKGSNMQENKTIEQLEPTKVFHFFHEICNIPHGSRNLQQISDYLVNFAKERGLWVRQDENLNVIIKKPASKGAEKAPTVILQGHMDMVAVKDRDCAKDMEKEGIEPYIEGDWLKAKGTSLGGDDGIAVAYALTVLEEDTLIHPAIEAVFTTDEEIGLLGATALDTSDLEGKMMLNMDSEDEGIFTVSCAGGGCAICHLPVVFEEGTGEKLKLTLTGLSGGHSGVEIHKGRQNSNVAMGRLLQAMSGAEGVRLLSLNGGTKDNVIANETVAELLVSKQGKKQAMDLLQQEYAALKEETAVTDPGIQLMATEEGEQTVAVLSRESAKAVVLLLNMLPNGVICMSPDIPNMVQTSLNLGVLRTGEKEVSLTYSVRSSKESQKHNLVTRLRLLTEFVGGTVEVEGEYPGWDFKQDSRLLEVMKEAYREQYGSEPVVEGIHAGLECGVFASKIEGLDAVSFGPQMHNVHSIQEELCISSVERTYCLVKTTLEKLSKLS